jgi:hypothetical protein
MFLIHALSRGRRGTTAIFQGGSVPAQGAPWLDTKGASESLFSHRSYSLDNMATTQQQRNSYDEKADIGHKEHAPHFEGVDENGEPIDRHTAVVIPETLLALSDEELVTLRKGITRKIDWLVSSWSRLSPTLTVRSCLHWSPCTF